MKVGRPSLAADHRNFDVFESRLLDQADQFQFGKSEPDVRIERAGLLEGVAQEVENHKSSTGFEDFVRGGQRFARTGRVVQGLTEEREVDRARFDRRIVNAAEAVFQIFQPVLGGKLRAELDHGRRVVDRDHFFGRAREQLRQRSLARARRSPATVTIDREAR